MIIKSYGCKRDTRDPRDFGFKPKAARRSFPPSVDLREWCVPTMAQGNIGSCVAHAISAVLRWHWKRAGNDDQPLSRLQLYYDGRVIENVIAEDSGLEIRDAIKSVKEKGVGREDLWPYDVAKFKEQPPAQVYEFANIYSPLTYERVPVSIAGLKAALAEGFPVVIGVDLYDSFESDEVERTGVVPMPDTNREAMAGGHCMAAYGYGQRPGYFTVQNSWGVDWGVDKGFCFIPEQYLGSPQLGSDYWVIRNVAGG